MLLILLKQTEAQFAINALSTLSQEAKALMTYPVAYDIEDSSISSKLDKNAITNNALLFTSLLSQNGYDTMVYSNTYDNCRRFLFRLFFCAKKVRERPKRSRTILITIL